jgi:hypothetical protein
MDHSCSEKTRAWEEISAAEKKSHNGSRAEFVEHPGVRLHQANQILCIEHTE